MFNKTSCKYFDALVWWRSICKASSKSCMARLKWPWLAERAPRATRASTQVGSVLRALLKWRTAELARSSFISRMPSATLKPREKNRDEDEQTRTLTFPLPTHDLVSGVVYRSIRSVEFVSCTESVEMAKRAKGERDYRLNALINVMCKISFVLEGVADDSECCCWSGWICWKLCFNRW